MEARKYELQRFNGKAYEPVFQGELKAVDQYGRENDLGPRRRIVNVEKARDLKPKYRKPVPGRAAALPVDAVIRRYLEWAKAKGLKEVAFYKNQVVGAGYAYENGIAVRWVDPAEFLGPAPAAEVIDELAEKRARVEELEAALEAARQELAQAA